MTHYRVFTERLYGAKYGFSKMVLLPPANRKRIYFSGMKPLTEKEAKRIVDKYNSNWDQNIYANLGVFSWVAKYEEIPITNP